MRTYISYHICVCTYRMSRSEHILHFLSLESYIISTQDILAKKTRTLVIPPLSMFTPRSVLYKHFCIVASISIDEYVKYMNATFHNSLGLGISRFCVLLGSIFMLFPLLGGSGCNLLHYILTQNL